MLRQVIALRRTREHTLEIDDPTELSGRGGIAELVHATTRSGCISPRLSGGDVDADWQRAESSGEEAAGGSEPTPDQDIVDEFGEALGVGRRSDAEFWTSGEILRERDRHRWELEADGDDR
jgi:hypothetical protein